MDAKYFTLLDTESRPCVASELADGRREIIAVFVNTERGHELAECVAAALTNDAAESQNTNQGRSLS